MRYLGLLLPVLVAVALVVGFVAYQVEARVLKPRRMARWEDAKERATWQDKHTTVNGKTEFVVQRIAVDGHRREVIDQQFIGSVFSDADDFHLKFDELWTQAKRRVYQLNRLDPEL